MLNGLIQLPWWGYILVTLSLTHVTIIAVTVYLHRCQAHRAIEIHPAVAHFFRFWLWLTSGMGTRQWTAVHRKHHAYVETIEDPHSPYIHGINKVLFDGVALYREESVNPDTLEKFGRGTPDDWLERHLYEKYSSAGYILLFGLNVVLFGPLGMTIWAVQMAWLPFFAAGLINGGAHYWGYRNYETPDRSTNLLPWGILVGGEELHNNHHAYASSACFAIKPWEFDLGWFYIRVLSWLNLARIKKVAILPTIDSDKRGLDLDALSAIVSARLQVMAHFARDVVKHVHHEELNKVGNIHKDILKPIKAWMIKNDQIISEDQKRRLAMALTYSEPLTVVYQFQQRLREIFAQRRASEQSLLVQLQSWCRQAEQTGIQALEDFAQALRGYTMVPA